MNATFGRYRLLERIGQGGMAEVFRAKSYGVEGFEKVVVIKRILPELAERPDFVTLFVQEAKLAVRLSHANVVQAFDLGTATGAYYIAMEYVQGADLAQILARAKRENRELPFALSVYVAAEVAKGLDYAHRRRDENGKPLTIVHRDVSPQNILVSFEGEVKVADFGIAKALGAPGEGDELEDTQSRRLRGKFAYMSPEQARGEPVDARTDIFSLGVVLYECITGANPFFAPSALETLRRVHQCEYPPPELLRPDVPAALVELLGTMLAQNREDRFADAGKLHEKLLSFLYSQGRRFSADDLAEFLVPFREPETSGELTEKLLTQDKTPAPTRTSSSVPKLAVATPSGEFSIPGAALKSGTAEPSQFPARFGEKRDVTAVAIDWPAQVKEREEGKISLLLDRYGGRVVTLDPSLTVVLFGLLDPDGRDAEIAARCALAVLRSSGVLGVGVHTARIVVDGAGEPVSDSALTTLVDMARELARTAPARVTVSRSAMRLLPPEYHGEEAPAPAPHGAQFLEPLTEAARLELDSGSSGDARQRRLLDGRFVGRREELRRVGEVFALASRKKAKVVVLSGVQGIGKTRLVREVQRRIKKGRYPVGLHMATCLPHGRTFPYSGIVCMLQSLLGVEDGDDEERILATRPRLRALGLTDDELAGIYATLGASVAAPEASLEGALFSAFAQIVRSLSEDSLQVFVWDAAHCIDQESLRLLATVHQRLPRVRSVFLLVARPGIPLPLLAEDSRVVIELADLGAADTRRLVEDRLGVSKVPDELLAFLAERAGGQPLFLTELTRALVASRAVTVAEEQVVEMRLADVDLSLPRTLRGLVSARLAELATHERAVLQAMAVLSDQVRLELLVPMLELPEAELMRIVSGLVERDFVYPLSADTYKFRSPIVRDVVEGTILAETRRALHGAAGSALEQASFPVPPSRVALHLYEAGDASRASVHFATSAANELGRKRYEAAARAYAKALELAEPEEMELGTLLSWLSNLALAARVARRVPDLVLTDVLTEIDVRGDRPTRVRAHIAAGRIYGSQHRQAAAKTEFDAAETIADDEPRLTREVLSSAAEVAAQQGEFERARTLYARLAAASPPDSLPADSTPDSAASIEAFKIASNLAFLHAATGDLVAARSNLAAAERAVLGDPVRALELSKTRGVVAYYSGLLADAALAFESAIDKARELGVTYEVAVNLHNLGDVFLRQNDHARAYGAFHQSLALATEAGHERLVLHDRMFAGYLDALAGEASGKEQLQQAVESAESREFFWDLLNGRRLLAELALHAGDRAGALSTFQHLAEDASRLGHRALAAEASKRADELR